MWTKIAAGIGILLVIFAGAAWYMFATMDSYILAAIENNGSAAIATKVTVRSVALSLASGRCVITGLTVGNPPGFSTPYALALGNITLHAELSSLFGSGPVIIDRVNIDRPHIFYEINGGDQGLSLKSLNLNSDSNLATLQRDARNSPGSGPRRKEIIRDLTVTNSEVSVSSTLLKGQVLTEKLPEIHLTDIGGATGVTAAQASAQVLTAITSEAALAGAGSLVKAIGGAATGPLGGAIADKLKSLF